MIITPTEQADLDKMCEDGRRAMEICMHLCREFLQSTPEQLRMSGHKTQEDGVVYSVRGCLAKLDQIERAHVRKWPDK